MRKLTSIIISIIISSILMLSILVGCSSPQNVETPPVETQTVDVQESETPTPDETPEAPETERIASVNAALGKFSQLLTDEDAVSLNLDVTFTGNEFSSETFGTLMTVQTPWTEEVLVPGNYVFFVKTPQYKQASYLVGDKNLFVVSFEDYSVIDAETSEDIASETEHVNVPEEYKYAKIQKVDIPDVTALLPKFKELNGTDVVENNNVKTYTASISPDDVKTFTGSDSLLGKLEITEYYDGNKLVRSTMNLTFDTFMSEEKETLTYSYILETNISDNLEFDNINTYNFDLT